MRLGTQVSRERVQAVATAGDQHQLMAASGKFQCDGLTDTRRRAGDDGGAIIFGCRNPHKTTLTALAMVV